jgi:hypothetical protein
MTPLGKLGLTVVTLAVVGFAVAITLATRTSASERGSLARISNEGRLVSVRGAKLARLLGARQASLLAVRGTRAYYHVDSKDGPCIASGPADVPGELGIVECPRGPFPSADRPVVDLSVYESTSRAKRELSLYRAAGVVADGVATIEFVRPNGSVALTVPVSGNVFAAASVPPGPIAGLVARNAAGKQLWRSP